MSVSFSTIVQRARPLPIHKATGALRDVMAKIPPTTVSALPNGFRVAAEENPNAHFATVGIWMDVGSKYEDRTKNGGTSRMLEVCGFQGTVNQSRQQISRAVEELGGHLHVETGVEHSYMYIKCAKDAVPKAISLLADVVQNARLADEDIAAAKTEINTARAFREEDVDKIVFENLNVAAFDSEDIGLGNVVNSTEDSVNALSKSTLLDFRETNYTANRFVLVGTGAVSHTQMEKVAKECFGAMANKPKPKISSRYVGGDYRLWNLRFKLCHVAWAFETCGANSGDMVPLTLATHIHSGFHRSQHELGQHTLHRLLKTYSSLDHAYPTATHFPEQCLEVCNSFIKSYEDVGLCGQYIVGRHWQTQPGASADAMLSTLQASMADWCRLAQRSIHVTELEQAKVNYKAQLLFNMDGATNSAEDIGRQVLQFGRRVPLEEMYARIDDISASNVMEVLQHYFYARKPVISMMGSLYIMPGYDWITAWTWKFWF